jgi:hypothetical protein
LAEFWNSEGLCSLSSWAKVLQWTQNTVLKP